MSFASCEWVCCHHFACKWTLFFLTTWFWGCNSVPFISLWCTSLASNFWPVVELSSKLIFVWFLVVFFTFIYFFSGARTNAKTLKLSSGLECRKISKNVFFSFHWLSSSLSKTRFIWFTILIRSSITLYKLISHCFFALSFRLFCFPFNVCVLVAWNSSSYLVGCCLFFFFELNFDQERATWSLVRLVIYGYTD